MRTASPRPDLLGIAMPGRAGADESQQCRHLRHVGGAHGVAVHGRSRKGGLGAKRGEIGRQGAAGGLGNGDGFGVDRAGDRSEDVGEGVGDGEEAHAPSSARQRPDLPPSFDSRRIPSIRMPRSAAFTMS